VVEAAGDGEQMTKKLAMSHFDLIVLDWMLPGEDGLSICMRLSNDDNSPPIIMLTANGTEDSRISGLEVGADDYMAKPFNPRELVARIHAVLRRRPQLLPAAIPVNNKPPMKFGPYQINFLERCLYKDNHKINLTDSEFALLKVLADYAGTPLSRERLAYLIDGRVLDPLNRSICKRSGVWVICWSLTRIRNEVFSENTAGTHAPANFSVYGVKCRYHPHNIYIFCSIACSRQIRLFK
jgi:two-component system phosphate regulon response regulator OmpR